eukprot:Pgem_evm1s16932
MVLTVCAQYAHHGHCSYGLKCPLSHNIQHILNENNPIANARNLDAKKSNKNGKKNKKRK